MEKIEEVKMSGEWKKTTCAFCSVCCGLEIKVENNHIVDVRPDPDNRRSKDYCCRKGRSSKYYQENPDRLRHPLKRVGDDFVEISWDQALREIGDKTNELLKKYGPHSLSVIGGTGANAFGPVLLEANAMMKLGIKNNFNPTGCEFMCYFWNNGHLSGRQARFMEPDEERMETLVLWGSNAYVSHMMINARETIREVSESEDKKLIVVDPRMSETARMADIHILLRAGSDALLLRAMITLILEKGWQHQDYLDKYVKDFDKVKPWFEGFDVKAACEVCNVPYEKLVELCKVLCTTKWGMHADLGIFMGRHNTMSCSLQNILMCVTGSLMTPGGSVILKTVINNPDDDWSSPKTRALKATGAMPVGGSYPWGSYAPEVLTDDPERIRASFVLMSNPARSFPDSDKVAEALQKLDLLVVSDIVTTETTQYAHYILPAKSVYESYDFSPFMWEYPNTHIFIKRPIIEAEGDVRETGEFWIDLMDAMGLMPKLPDYLYKAAEEAVASKNRMKYSGALIRYLATHPQNATMIFFIIGKTLGKAMGSVQLASYWAGLMLGTDKLLKEDCARAGHAVYRGKFNAISKVAKPLAEFDMMDQIFQKIYDNPEGIVFAKADVNNNYSNILHKDHKLRLFTPEMDEYIRKITPDREREALYGNEEYPFVMSAGIHRDGGHNGWMRNHATHVYRNPCTMEINPEDAMELGLTDGGKARLITKTTEAEVDVEYSYRTSRGYVTVPHHHGFTVNGKTYGIGVNKLTGSDECDPVTGDPVWRYIPCRIERTN